MLADWIGADSKDVTYTCAGINHQAFYLDYRVKGEDAYPALFEAIKREEVANEEPIRVEMFKHLGYFPTESSGHNSEYNAWFRKRPDLIEKYTKNGTGWNPGEHAFILKEYLEREDSWEKEYQEWLDEETVDLERGEEYASHIFNALLGDGTPFYFNGNIRNKGYITNIEEGACVEVPMVASKDGITPTTRLSLPIELQTLVNNSSLIEEMAVQAALKGDPNLVFQAILFDPLTAAVLSMEEIRTMTQEMLDKKQGIPTIF